MLKLILGRPGTGKTVLSGPADTPEAASGVCVSPGPLLPGFLPALVGDGNHESSPAAAGP